MYQSKSKLQIKQQPSPGKNFSPVRPSVQDQQKEANKLMDYEEDIENDKELNELSLYKKLVVQSVPKNKSKQAALKDHRLSAMPAVLNDMVNQMKPTYEKRQVQALIDELKKHKSLQQLLHGVKPEQLSNEEVVLLLIWTSPLVTSVSNNDEYSTYARGILGVDVLQAQGMLRNCQTDENHLINIVESYFQLMRSMPQHQFLQVLRNSVYTLEKAYELEKTLQTLGENWFNLKEQIKTLKLEEAPKIENPKLVKGVSVNQVGGKIAANLKDYQEVDILVKLVPFFDIPMSKSSKVVPEAAQLRKMLNIAKSEAEMILRNKRLNTLLDVIKAYFEKLLQPENQGDVELEFLDCFFQSKQRSRLFVQSLARVIWEYNYVNKMFIEHYRKLSSVSSKNPHLNVPQSREVMIFGGHYPLSSGQIGAMVKIVMQFSEVKTLTFNFARIKNQGLQLIVKTLNANKWKTIKLNDDLLFSLDLTNNFIDQDGVASLIDLFFDQFDMKSAQINEAPIPTSIRILTLDYNFLGKGGADALGTILSSSRQLKVLSLNRTRMIGNDMKKFFQSLGVNPYLKALSLGQNKLGDSGIQYLANALKVNIGLTFLDLFDVDFGDDGAISLAEALLLNKTLFNLRLSNTKIKENGATPLLNAVIGNYSLKIFRWVNLLPLPAKEDMEPKEITRVFMIESRNNPMSRMEYYNPFIGDLPFEAIKDVHKCAYFSRQKDINLNRQIDFVLSSYCDYLIENWTAFEKGTYNTLNTRPEGNFRQMITEDIVRDNLPELNLEERVLITMDTLDIPKDKVGQQIINGVSQGSEFKMLEAEKKKTSKKVSQPVRKEPQQIAKNTAQLQQNNTQLDSVPSFSMSEFAQGSVYTRNVAKELLITLLQYGLDVNYNNSQGYTPLQESIKNKLRTLQNFMLSGFCQNLDINMRCQAIGKQMSTAMHMAVELNDYDSLKLILDYNGEPRRELGLKDGKGKNSLDIAFELDFASMKDLLQRNGGHQSSLAIQEQQKILQIMKPISTRKNEQEPITLFNTIIANSTDRFQKLLMQGEDINQRDAQNQVPLHYTVQHSREQLLMMLIKQGAFIDAKDINGMTPLHQAANKKDQATQNQNLKIIERLVSLGSNIDSQMKDGSTPLHLACQAGSYQNVKLLCELGAHIGIFNFAKQQPQDVTTQKEILDLLSRVRQERRRQNGGGDEYLTDIM